MKNRGRITENLRVETNVLRASSDSTNMGVYAYSTPVSLKGCDRVAFILSCGTADGVHSSVSIVQAANSSAIIAGSGAVIAGCTGIVLGSTNATNVTKVKRARITVSAGVTSADVVVINGATLAFTGSTAGASSVLTFGNSTPGGASAGASAAGGRDMVSNKLASVINNSSYGLSSMMVAATVTTAALDVWVKDTAATSLTIGGTAAGFVPSVIAQQSIVEINADKLDSTSEYVAALVSTAATSVAISVVTIRDGQRYAPPSTAAYHTRTYIKGT